VARRVHNRRNAASRSFRGAPEGREPGIQDHLQDSRLDSGSGANAPSRHDDERAPKIRVARIGAAHGVRGEVKLWPFTENPLAVADYGLLETEDGKRRVEIETVRQAKDHLVARIVGVDDRNAAELLRNIDLFVPRDRLPPIEDDDTYYYADLIGLAAVTPDGEAIGTVLALHNFGAGDVIEIQPASGGATLMLPFTEAIVPEVDVKCGRVVVVVPESSDEQAPEPNSAHSRASGNPEQ
jgi:16S rRNA processing protein RimM